MKALRLISNLLLYSFAAIGFVFTSVFIAMEFGWLNVRGSIEDRNNSIIGVDSIANSLDVTVSRLPARLIQIGTSTPTAPDVSCADETDQCPWQQTREWNVVAGGLQKDLALINRVAAETDVSPRLIATVIVPEQIRFFTAEREVFKRYFEPLKILGSLSKFSLGVSGIKQETAEKIERFANDETSLFYPGKNYADLIAYPEEPIDDRDALLFNRLTDEKDHYYSYLYTALFIKEIIAQWRRAGYDLTNEPEVIATLFNLGFDSSNPKTDPQVGGSLVTVGGTTYSFGALAGLFYHSPELPQLQK